MEHYKQQLTEAYNQYSDAIFRYCYFKISDREKALDLTAETFTRMWIFLKKGNEVENTKTFLYTIARNIVIDEYRKRKTLSLDNLMDQGMEPSFGTEENIFDSFDIVRVLKLIELLPKNHSSIIIMRYINDLSIQEIAQVINESENVVSVRIHRSICKLRKLVEA